MIVSPCGHEGAALHRGPSLRRAGRCQRSLQLLPLILVVLTASKGARGPAAAPVTAPDLPGSQAAACEADTAPHDLLAWVVLQ